ncbi:MAG: hypothetical protein JO269_03175 [Burkholderiaceae bacterium]|nr:hypothetical protein [Burkholderiaceae bacterium]
MRLFFAFCFALVTSFSLIVMPAGADEKVFSISAKIKDPVASDVRQTKYEDPLDAALKAAKVGEVVGGGNSVDAKGKIEWAGVDIEVNDLQAGLALIKEKLVSLGAPKGSTLEYKAGGKKVVVPVQ